MEGVQSLRIELNSITALLREIESQREATERLSLKGISEVATSVLKDLLNLAVHVDQNNLYFRVHDVSTANPPIAAESDNLAGEIEKRRDIYSRLIDQSEKSIENVAQAIQEHRESVMTRHFELSNTCSARILPLERNIKSQLHELQEKIKQNQNSLTENRNELARLEREVQLTHDTLSTVPKEVLAKIDSVKTQNKESCHHYDSNLCLTCGQIGGTLAAVGGAAMGASVLFLPFIGASLVFSAVGYTLIGDAHLEIRKAYDNSF